MKRLPTIVSLLPSILLSCSVNWDVDNIFEPQIAVEGWIDDGEPATVILTQMLPYNNSTESGPMDMKDIPIRWATVSVSDGEKTEMLVGQIDTNYTPPYVYSGSSIKGVPGRTYTLTVKYSGRTLVAETTVPEPVHVDRYEVSPSLTCDTLYSIRIYFRDDPDRKNFYKAFTKVKNTDKRYFAAFMGDISDEVLGEDAYMIINRAFRHTRLYEHTPFFKPEDTVYVKFTQVPEAGFEFWSSYENEVTSGANILFPNTSDLKSNISGGRGIWCGYGTDIVEIVIKDEAGK